MCSCSEDEDRIYDDEYIRFAKPDEVGKDVKRFQNNTLMPTEMSFDFVYTPPSGTVNIPEKYEKIEKKTASKYHLFLSLFDLMYLIYIRSESKKKKPYKTSLRSVIHATDSTLIG